MSQSINFDPIRLPPEAEELRLEVREFWLTKLQMEVLTPLLQY